MDNIIFSANIVLPLLVVMIAGNLTKRIGLLDEKSISSGNNLVFKIFLSTLVFCNIYSSDFANLKAVGLFSYVAIMIILSFAVSTVFAVLFEKENKRRGVMVQGLARTNYAMLGIPLLGLLFEGQDVALGSLLVAVVIPLYSIFTVAALTYFGSKNSSFKSIMKSIFKNPLIIGSILGLSFAFLGIKIPGFLYDGLVQVGSIATPLALFLLGATFEMKAIKNVMRPLIAVLLGRLFILPAIAVGIGAMLGFRDIELGCILITFAAPTAATSYTMAVQMGGDGELASTIVIFTSAFCMFSLFLFILALKTFALI
ncbi:MAG: AEC family transporter [Clostridia bacterium]